ncbi:RAB11-binding protein RELCH isoform X5 [Canis lupus familiaris]|uniref:RAB11-binding protein RELCH isoform X5 n=1 Tax=Canis lupus familiaris TaxID=9615 RepID=UPI0003ADEA44|nr:RAB11-binding protein RELCH isoform X5 [Canis lupus familiaris]XP_038509930.1 RAB11-binding protein RELCH isoform X5 [Canis lupus familiaris]|eukprot:XP_005615406.1 lisH domain and HEAT repeat-containing protein KIAA1468 homolog isoform X5 [Canis lupus familiaris]
MAAMAPGGGGSGGGGVNPFLSDSDEDDDEVAATEERRAGLRLGSGSGLDPGSADSLSPQDPVALGSSARPGLPGEAAAAAAALGGCGETPGRLSIDAIAAQLLRDQYLLTALELHTELLESGRELPRLRDYFSNPGNFERQSGTPPGMGAPGMPGAAGGGGAGGREPSTTSGGGQLNRAGSISTLDSLDFARYSDDGNRETDERVAVLEFELRKAKETIQALRANLTKAAEHEVPLQERKNYKSSPEIQEPIKPLEKRALNFLVNEFLLKNNYKLTSITFSDENDDQDFELWDDVGLNIPKPPDLLQLYRDFGNHQVTGKDLVDVASGVEEDELEALTPVLGNLPPSLETPQTVENSLLVQKLEDKISLLNNEKWSLMEQIRRLESEMDFLKNEHFAIPVVCDSVQPSLDHKDSEDSGQNPVINNTDKGKDKNNHLSKSDEVDSTIPKENFPNSVPRREKEEVPSSPSSKNTVHFDKPNRKLSPAFHQALLSFCRMSADSRLGSEVSRIADSEKSVMLMLGRCLPHIVPNVLLAKRERMVLHLCQELIPLILCTACLHPEPKERDQLLHILFNLIKRPDDEQRQMILTGCVAFARHVGPTRVEAELLPQCWEQINHKYPERRLLVAESCGALAPYLPKEIRSSLVLSMLQQMLMEDKADLVREAVIKSLGIIMGYIDDPDKYQQGFELLLSALGDPSERVVSATHQVFLPAYAAWTTELGNLQSHLIPTLLNKIEKLLREGEHGLDEHKLHMYLSALQSLIPSLFALVLRNAPFSSKAKLHGEVPQIEVTRFPRPMSPLQDVSTIIGSREQLAVLLQLYDYQLEHEGTTGWETLLWVVNQLLPQLIEIVGKINVTSTACVHEFSRFFWRLCRTFGKIFTNTKVKPQFQEILRLSEENIDSSAGNGVLTKATVPIYATGVLTCYIQEEDRKLLVGFLEDVMTLLSLSHAPLDSLKASFVELGANPAYHELLLTVLWYGVVHTSALVRCTAARMFELLVKGVNETLVAQRVVPALITLSSDPEISVRIATIPAFGTIMETVIQRELLERVKMQLASFLEDPQYQDQYSLHTEIIKTFGRVGPNAEPRFRDEFVIPHLHKLALVNNLQIVDSKRLDIATHLFEAYSALSCCFISEDLMVNHFLPGLRCLRTDMEHLSPEHEVILSSMIKECEQKVENKTVQEPQGLRSMRENVVYPFQPMCLRYLKNAWCMISTQH